MLLFFVVIILQKAYLSILAKVRQLCQDYCLLSSQLKFIYSEKATQILRNLPLTFDHSTYSQKLAEDFAKFCGLLRIYEL